jgi:bifunctional oligoribonuclease and PAP phosphatase NrnA
MRVVIDLSKYTKELSKYFSTSENILLVCHINPDGDAIGSQIALYHYLISKGRNVKMLSPNNLQEFLMWLDGSEFINVYIRDRKKAQQIISEADLIVMLDFNQPGRLGEAENVIMSATAKKIIIDHHLGSADFADLFISDSSMSSTAELVYELIIQIEGEPFISISFAEALYVGIITDTGNFEHGSYTGRTLRIVADFIDAGIKKNEILNLIYNNFSSGRMMLLGYALNQKMTVLPEYKTAFISLSKDDLSRYQHEKGDTEGFVNLPLSIRGIVFSALFIEKENFVKISFRSIGSFPTNEFAAEYFSGGGHLNASGGEIYASLDDTITYFLKVLHENKWKLED